MEEIIIKHPAGFETTVSYLRKHNGLVAAYLDKFTWDTLSIDAMLNKIEEQYQEIQSLKREIQSLDEQAAGEDI